jgi:signal transduction histidine kinase
LDTLANLQFGSGKDSAEIITFIEKMEKDFHRLKINQKPKDERDSVKFIDTFLKNQKRFYTSLWYIYRIIENNPNINRALLDSFFTAQRAYYESTDKNLWHIQSKSITYTNKESQTIPNLTFKNDLKRVKDGKKITIIFSDTFKNSNDVRDSFLSKNAYQFQRFVGGMIKPEELKGKLEYKFPNLNFNVSRIDTDSLEEGNTNKGIVCTFPAGSRQIIDEYGISYKNQKMSVLVTGFQATILKGIYNEILFALFVLLMVGVSFWLIYHNILEQKRLITQKNDFINNMTHELKTPITTVGVAIEAITDFGALNNPEQTKEYLDISKNELSRLSLMVDKVLKMAVFENGEAKLNIEKLRLNEMTQEVINSMRLQCEKYNANIQFEDKSGTTEISGDKAHITSVIYNLIDNALKYGGEKPDIKVEIQPFYNDFLRLTVQDNGAGIPPQYQEKIFEKFFRIPTGDVHTVKGHGLGLNYVKNVIEQHGGKIHIQSEEGKGSTFSIFLPLDLKEHQI